MWAGSQILFFTLLTPGIVIPGIFSLSKSNPAVSLYVLIRVYNEIEICEILTRVHSE